MFNLIDNQFGKICLNRDADCEPMFVYTFKDYDGRSDDCEYAFVFRNKEIHLYGWHFGHDTTFAYTGSWIDGEYDGAFHDRDYQDGLVRRLRLCLKGALNNIVMSTIEYL